MRDLCVNAVDAALAAGATYSDARAVLRRSQSVNSKNGVVEALRDAGGAGIGWRVRADGAVARPEVKEAEAVVRAQPERKVLIPSEGTDVEQEHVECGGGIDAMAVGDGVSQLRSYPSAHGGSSAQAGWEYVVALG